MNQAKVLALVDPLAVPLLDMSLLAWDEFNKHHPEPIRAHMEGARPKWINELMTHYLEMQFGKNGPVRVVEHKGVKYLMIEGPEFNVGIRAKKLGPDWRSYNHTSGQQRSLRANGTFPWETDNETFHLILGYLDTGGLQPAMTHIAITWETSSDVEVIKLLWTQSEGRIPIRLIQQNIEEPKLPKIRKKRDLGEGERGAM